MPFPLKHLVACLAVLLTTRPVVSQQPTSRTIVLLDPAHGGPDTGAHLPNALLEKDITLAFAARLRTALASSGFTVMATRDTDPAAPFTTDQRAEIGNHAHPTACLILHASSSGNGVHIITSALSESADEPHAVIPWDTAQAASIPQSLSLANQIGLTLRQANLPVILSRASVRPLDNLICPAVAVEIAPLAQPDAVISVTDTAYQQNIAKAIADALTSWRGRQAVPAGAQK